MENRRVPHQLQRRLLILAFDHLWRHSGLQDCNERRRWPRCRTSCRRKLAIHAHLGHLKRGFLTDLVLRLRPVLFSPGDFVCRKGEVGRQMYIVSQGRLQVMSDGSDRALATLRARLLLWRDLRAASAAWAAAHGPQCALWATRSAALALPRADLWAVLERPPAARVQLEAIANAAAQGDRAKDHWGGVQPAEQQVRRSAGRRRRVPGEGLVGQLAHRPQLLGQAVPRVWRLRQQPRPQQRRQEGAGKVTAAEQAPAPSQRSAPGRFQRTDGRPGPPRPAPARSPGKELDLPNRAGLPGELPAQPVAVAGQSQLSAGRVRGAGGRLAGQSDGSKQAGAGCAGSKADCSNWLVWAGAGSRVAAAVAAGRRVALPAARQPVRALLRQTRRVAMATGRAPSHVSQGAAGGLLALLQRLHDNPYCGTVDQLGVQVGRGAGCFGQRHQNL
uniref:Cyclic nucleotide-binding domain-containing protein n=1 Tax=Macrostomum lignano TaxID=282301 RepID=A0A1I8FRV3_9PLAT